MSESAKNLRLYARAFREGWLVPAEVASKAIEAATTCLDSSSGRIRLNAAKTLIAAGRLALDVLKVEAALEAREAADEDGSIVLEVRQRDSWTREDLARMSDNELRAIVSSKCIDPSKTRLRE